MKIFNFKLLQHTLNASIMVSYKRMIRKSSLQIEEFEKMEMTEKNSSAQHYYQKIALRPAGD